MSIRAGETFLFDLKQDKAHLWVIATDPNEDGFILVVSLTSLKGSKDQTVILNPGDHPFIKWPTCVAYGLSDLMTVDRLADFVKCGQAKMHTPMGVKCLELVLDGFLSSDFSKKRIIQFVKHYKSERLGRS